MEDDSSADDLLIDVDEEDFALTAEELEQAEEMLGSNAGVGVGVKTKEHNTGVGIGAKVKEQESSRVERVESKPEIKDKASGGAEPGFSNLEVKAGQSIQVEAGRRLEAASLVDQPLGAAVAEKKVSSAEVVVKKEESKMGGSKFTVKKVSTRPAGQQPFAFGKPTALLSNKQVGTQAASVAPFTFGNRNRPDPRFGIGQAMLPATPAASIQSPRDPRRSQGTFGAPSGTSQARHIPGVSPASATTSAVTPQALLPTVASQKECEPRSSSSIALQRMGPSALERMAAEQEKKCREENMKKEQLEKMVALKRANARSQGLGNQVSPLTKMLFSTF